ncbi:MAG: DNA polymerase III subunit gamma/tau [Lachnospiraceae bacterium]|nr:DNA polymerase III subunit gamma/tau [Lachnospiraceae bacterium]
MSYLALYRKYRPSSFDRVKGQDHIVTTLKNQMNAGRIGHAYLFCGTRGTGKTSVAKLFAKAVNCEHPIDGSPCGECAVCRAIDARTSMNVIEIDAASNNGVDNIRDIIDEVRYSPTEGKYKVYIIDEVHMLSSGAFNALLKTLEEPPSYVIFILATTEVHKIPVTILSRCQRYDFKRITVDTITECLADLMRQEGIETEDKALRYIAKTADGSMRDAQSLLDQCIAFYLGQKLTYEKVLEVLGAVDIDVFSVLLRYILKGSVDTCLSLLDDIVMQGRELTQFVNDFAWYLRNLLIAKTADDPAEVLEFSADNMQLLLSEAEAMEEGTIIRYIRILSELSNRIRYASQKRLMVEVELIKMCRPDTETRDDTLSDRIRVLEQKLESGVFRTAGEGSAEKEEQEEQEPQVLAKPLTDDIRKIAENWNTVINKQSPLIRNSLITAKPTVGEGDKLKIVFTNDYDMGAVAREERLADLKRSLAVLTGKDVEVELEFADKNKAGKMVDITQFIKNMPIEYTDSEE